MKTQLRWILLVTGLCAFGLFVWPTRYDRYTYQGMTVLRDRVRGCEKILTPVRPVSVGGDERCFLPGEGKTASVLFVPPDAEVSEPEEVTRIVDDTMREVGLPDYTSERQLRVMEGLEVTVTLARPLPVLRVVNRSRCTVEQVTLRTRWRGRDLGEAEYWTGSLNPGEERRATVSMRVFSTDPQITLTNVMFHDDGDWQDSACAAP